MKDNSSIKPEEIVQETLTKSLQKFGSTTSIDNDYELIKELVNKEESKESTCVNVWKPNLKRYPDAIVDVEEVGPVFVPDVNDKIAIEFPNNWRDTVYGPIKKIFHDTGIFRVWDERKGYYVMSNYKEGPKMGLIYKLAPKRIGDLKMKRNRKS